MKILSNDKIYPSLIKRNKTICENNCEFVMIQRDINNKVIEVHCSKSFSEYVLHKTSTTYCGEESQTNKMDCVPFNCPFITEHTVSMENLENEQ